ncbi:MAG: DNA-binding protein [Eubacterium sp.]
MDYLTAKQLSEKWNISVRRILKLCEDGRIEGAVKIAGVWLFPPNVQKPKDARIKSGKYIKVK